jgi:KaiC/GvpD/RAD55 family RecA-like ATPase
MYLMPENHNSIITGVTIEGLNEALRQKLQQRQNILLIGTPFSGKTTLALQFLASGLRAGEGAILVTTTDTPDGIRAKAKVFGWDLRRYESRGQLHYIDCYSQVVGLSVDDSPVILKGGVEEEHFDRVSIMISAVISDYWREGMKVRLVFDNLTTLFYYNDLVAIARFLHTLLGRLKAVNATSLLILESGIHDEQVTTVVRSFCDGALQLSGDGDERYIQGIIGAGSLGRLPIQISKRGLRVASSATKPPRWRAKETFNDTCMKQSAAGQILAPIKYRASKSVT